MAHGSTSGKKRRAGLNRLHKLCAELNDRDQQIKSDVQLFEGFFSNFPIPVTMWSIGKDHAILSKRGNAFTCHSASTLEELFECPVVREQSIKKHEEALGGTVVSYFVENSQHIYWTKLVPRFSETNDVIGVVGIAWDVTTNAVMLSSLENILNATDGTTVDVGLIKKEAQKALSVSRLKKMLDNRGGK